MTTPGAPEYGTPEWLEWRRGGIGASELPTILNANPYQTEHELWEHKTGHVPASPGNPRTRWGHRLEAVGLEVWAAEHGCVPTPNTRAYRELGYPHLWATPDATASTPDGLIGIEVKVTSAWLDPPDRVRIQALAQAGLAGLDRVDIVRLSFDDDPAIFPIERDESSIADILAAGESWYVQHVIEGVEPPRRPDEVAADERQQRLAADLRSVRKAMELLEKQEHVIRDDLIASVAGQGIIAGQGFRIDITRARGATRTGWREVASSYRKALEPHMSTDELDTIEGLYQTTSNAQTRLTARWDEEDQG